MRGYGALWRVPGAPTLLVFGFVGRLGISTEPLGLILLVQHATGRYSAAALASAAYTLAYAAAQPVAGRLTTRFSPSTVLPVIAVAHPIALITLVLSARVADSAFVAVVAAAILSGATSPPVVAVLRSTWTRMTEPDGDWAELRGTALAADTSLYQSVFVVGPLVVAAVVAAGSASALLVASAMVTGIGTVVLARGAAMRAMPARTPTTRVRYRGLPHVPGFPAMLACSAALGMTFGVVTVAVPAFATGHGSSGALAGLLLAILGTGSVLGGVAFGAVRLRAPLPRQFAALLGTVAASFAVYSLMRHPAALAVALFCGGALVTPVLTVESALVGRIVPAAVRTEAYTWMVGAEVTATAIGLQATGLVVDQPGGLPWAFLFASAATLPAALLTARRSGSIARAARLGRAGSGDVVTLTSHETQGGHV
jgi:MFS family permease